MTTSPTSPVPASTSTSPIQLPRTPITSPITATTTTVNLLASAAAHVESRTVTYGPLWNVRCATKGKARMPLQVYDVFCMIFLDCPGAYYRIDQHARANRGDITPELIIRQLRTYHRLVCPEPQKRIKPEVQLTNTQLKEWWLMPTKARSAFDNLLAAASSPPPAYDYSYVRFLKHFLPQSCRTNSDLMHQFFKSLANYMPLLVSTNVQLRPSPALANSSLCYGIFALRPLKDGLWTGQVQAVRGEVVLIPENEHSTFVAAGADFSVVELDADGMSRLLKPGQQGRKRQRVSQERQYAVVAGGMAFVNHACERHANMHPAVWRSVDDMDDMGRGQWQVLVPKRDVGAGEELLLHYGGYTEDEMRSWPCSMCTVV